MGQILCYLEYADFSKKHIINKLKINWNEILPGKDLQIRRIQVSWPVAVNHNTEQKLVSGGGGL